MLTLMLGQREFRRFALTFALSRAGDFLLSVAMVVFVYQQTHSTTWVAAAAIARLLPHVLLSSVGGSIGNRFGRRLLVVSDVIRAVLNTALVLAALAGSLPAVLVLSALAAVAGVGYGATSIALIPRLVPDGRTAQANATISAIESVSLLAGPALGGILLAVASPASTFGLNACSFVISAVVIASLRLRPPPRQTRATNQSAPVDRQLTRSTAFKLLLLDPDLRAVTVGAVGTAVVIGTVSVTFVVLSVGALGTGDAGVGYLMAAFGAGGVAGALAAGRVIDHAATRLWVAVLLAVTGIALAAMTGVRSPLLAWALAATLGVTGAFLEVLSVTKVQAAEPENAATLCGALDSLCYASVLLGLLLAPTLVTLVGNRCLLVVGASMLLLAAAALRAGAAQQLPPTAIRTASDLPAPVGDTVR
jgi:MFS family permease